MDRNLIMEMLSKLPPERLGQMVSEAQNPEKMINLAPNKKAGFRGSLMPAMMNQQQEMYKGPIGRN